MINHHTHGSVHELQMHRPPANALSPELVGALDDALAEATASHGQPSTESGFTDRCPLQPR